MPSQVVLEGREKRPRVVERAGRRRRNRGRSAWLTWSLGCWVWFCRVVMEAVYIASGTPELRSPGWLLLRGLYTGIGIRTRYRLMQAATSSIEAEQWWPSIMRIPTCEQLQFREETLFCGTPARPLSVQAFQSRAWENANSRYVPRCSFYTNLAGQNLEAG